MNKEENNNGWRKNYVTFATDNDNHFNEIVELLQTSRVAGDTMRTGKSLKEKSFSAVLAALKMGKGARLPHWISDAVVRAQFPEEGQKITHPYLCITYGFSLLPWKANEIELFAENWEIVD